MNSEEGTAQGITGQYDCPSVSLQSKSVESNYDYEPYDGADSTESQERSSERPVLYTASLLWHPRLLFCTFCLLIWHTADLLYNNAGSLSCDSLNKRGIQPNTTLSYCAANPTPVTALAPFVFQPLPLGSIKPQGWLRDQMNLMADGLAGHEYEFYEIVHDSPWLGGQSEYSSLNEGFPYWFNGLVPLAYGLDDPRLKMQVRDAVDYALAHQQLDGWLGPETDLASRDIWGRFPLFLGLIQLIEADSAMGPSLIPVMYKFIDLMLSLLREGQGSNQIWGRARYADMVISLQWLYENYPESRKSDLLENMCLLKTNGLDWAGYYDERSFIFNDLDTVDLNTTEADFGFVHAVNAGQGLKTGAVDYRFTRNQTSLQSTRNGVNYTFLYHGAASGTIIGDERESGLAPNRGSELCTAVETMYSLSYLYHTLGDNSFADRCELAAFNAMPVMLTSDIWAHQYIAQPNQPWSRPVSSSGLFWNVGDYGTTYGLAPNYPCCTVNFPQGLPKFIAASFVHVGVDGLGHALLGPASVSAALPSGALVNVSCETRYPFGDDLHYTIQSTAPSKFYIRIPQWNTNNPVTIFVDGQPSEAQTPDPQTGMTSAAIPQGTTTISLNLNPSIRIEPRANSTVSIYHGSLLYALDVGQSIQIAPDHDSLPLQHEHSLLTTTKVPIPPQSHSYAITNTLPWNIAIDPSTLTFHTSTNATIDSSTTGLPNPIWGYQAPPGWITAKGCQITWAVDHGVPARVPLEGQRGCVGGVVEVVLRPYGSLKVHMAELPVVRLNGTGVGR